MSRVENELIQSYFHAREIAVAQDYYAKYEGYESSYGIHRDIIDINEMNIYDELREAIKDDVTVLNKLDLKLAFEGKNNSQGALALILEEVPESVNYLFDAEKNTNQDWIGGLILSMAGRVSGPLHPTGFNVYSNTTLKKIIDAMDFSKVGEKFPWFLIRELGWFNLGHQYGNKYNVTPENFRIANHLFDFSKLSEAQLNVMREKMVGDTQQTSMKYYLDNYERYI